MRSAHKATLATAVLLATLCAPAAQGAVPSTATGSPSALARYYDQRPTWHRCETWYPATYQCATITVPLDYARPAGPTLRLQISRIRTSVPGKRRGVLLSNPGGPGEEGLSAPLQLKKTLSKSVQDRYDLIGLDPRGMATSSPLHCALNQDELTPLHPFRPAAYTKEVARARAIASKCTARNGAKLLPYINTLNTARDMDVVRGVLREKKISYVGWSYGTYLGAVYTQLFPRHSDRIVLDSAVNPNNFGRGALQAMASGSEPAFRDWSRAIARKNRVYHLGDTPAKVRAAFQNLVARADRTPLRYAGSDDDHQGRALTGADIREWLRPKFFDARDQAAREIVSLRTSRTTRPDPRPTGRAYPFDDNATALTWAVICGDNSASWPRNPARYRHDAIKDGARLPLYGDFTSNITPCAFWPRGSEPAPHVDNTVPALVVQNQWDPQTPLPSGQAMHRALRGSRLVYVASGRGHTIYAFPDAPTCVTHTVDAYLTGGPLPSRDVTCRS